MRALVLAGGEGTRLRPLTEDVPKPALPLVDRPFIRYMVDWLAGHGVEEIVIACGYRAELVREALAGGQDGPGIDFLEEEEPLGTGGPLRLAADSGLLPPGEPFLALNGDVLCDLDLGALIAAHREHRAAATLALYPVEDPSAYGLVQREEDGSVTGFVEKPEPEDINTDEISAGAYVLDPSALGLIPAGRAVSIEREVFPRLVGQGLYGARLTGYWLDIGTPERYLRASWDILEGRVKTDAPQAEDGVWIAADANVDAKASVGPRAVIGPGCEVGPGARVARSVLMDGCVLGAGARVEDSILAPGARVAGDVHIGPGAVLGQGEVAG